MNHYSGSSEIHSAQELLSTLAVDPKRRMLVYGSDLSEDEFDDGVATRCDDCVLMVLEGDGRLVSGAVLVVATVGSEMERDIHGRKTPQDIQELMRRSEEGTGPLGWVYDGAFALTEHPCAEARV